jgi:hypothetical protein
VQTAEKIVFLGLLILLGPLFSICDAQSQPPAAKAVYLTGLSGVKNNTAGTLTVDGGSLRFAHAKRTSDLASAAMQDVVTGSDSQREIRGTLGTLSLFSPYGSGRFLALFRSKLDTLTIQYLDSDGGVHGVIFTTPVGEADVIKGELIGQGAHTSIPAQGDPVRTISSSSDRVESPSPAQQARRPKVKATAISVQMIQSDEIPLPAEFQVSLYENLIEQLGKKGGFHRVYREGDRNSSAAPDLIVLHSTVRGFKQGSQMAREVTTVAGATSIRVHCEFTDKDGQLLLARDIDGKVLFFGANLKATYDFAKKAASVAHNNFSPAAGS